MKKITLFITILTLALVAPMTIQTKAAMAAVAWDSVFADTFQKPRVTS